MYYNFPILKTLLKECDKQLASTILELFERMQELKMKSSKPLYKDRKLRELVENLCYLKDCILSTEWEIDEYKTKFK